MEKRKVKLKDGREVILRLMAIDDKERLLEMFSSMSKEALRWSMAPYTREVIERWVKNIQNLIPLVAEHDNLMIGYAGIMKLPHPRLKGNGDLAMYIHQDFQGVGLGTIMTELLVNLAKEHGMHRVGLYVIADNKIAIHLYKKLGFEVEGNMKDSFFGEDGKYHDVLIMGRILNES
ncbi:MAG: GNAT family protein [Candidatus Bathyarchaeota archaeon]|jgi:RimJ/RimL family protein N-acetyltransferase